MKRFSVVIPAHNEEAMLGGCLESVREAGAAFSDQVETVVVINRCTDRTEQIARDHGAVIAYDDSKNLSRIRNVGAHAATGEVLVTLDADSTLSPNFFSEVNRHMKSGRVIGGATRFKLDRMSLGMALTALLMVPLILWYRVAGGAFWLLRKTFEELGGFDETRLSFEDVEFARRLKAHGRKQGKRFKILLGAYIITSARKFDRFGDWYFLLRPWLFFRFFRGADQATADRYWYEVEREPVKSEDDPE